MTDRVKWVQVLSLISHTVEPLSLESFEPLHTVEPLLKKRFTTDKVSWTQELSTMSHTVE